MINDNYIKDTGYKKVSVELIGQDGDAFAIMGRVIRAMKKADIPKEIRNEYRREAMSGDYSHLIYTTLQYAVEQEEIDGEDETNE